MWLVKRLPDVQAIVQRVREDKREAADKAKAPPPAR